MSRARQKNQSEEVRKHILEIAKRIISENGVDALSIRRITKEMDYSAGIVYHYFKNKDEIVECILRETYQKILDSVKPPDTSLPPDETIRMAFTGYIRNGLASPMEYRAIMFNSAPRILDATAVLEEGICEMRPAFKGLIAALEKGVATGLFAPCDINLTAQALWSAMFGLLSRLIIEGNVSPEQQSRLIERQINILLKGLKQ